MGKRNCLKPIRMWIDGKCYDISKYERKKYECMKNVLSQNGNKNDKKISKKIILPSIYYSKLVKYRNPQLNSVQNETNTVINFPTPKKEGFLEILGESDESIEEAEKHIHCFIADIRNQLSPLQFIAIPLLSDEIKHNFEEFKKDILSRNYQGVEESIFQSASKLHLTISVFTLLSEQEKQHAINVLEEIKTTLAPIEKPLRIRVMGIQTMNENFSKVNVLYAKPSFIDNSNPEGSLQNRANAISNLFYERGLCREIPENVKLHMTLMNTKYRKLKDGSSQRKWVKRETFNATEIVEQFKDYYFGEVDFDTIHLSLMSSNSENGFYKSIGSIKI